MKDPIKKTIINVLYLIHTLTIVFAETDYDNHSLHIQITII